MYDNGLPDLFPNNWEIDLLIIENEDANATCLEEQHRLWLSNLIMVLWWPTAGLPSISSLNFFVKRKTKYKYKFMITVKDSCLGYVFMYVA